MKTFTFALIAIGILSGIVGCGNIGNENPISPEMMKEQGEKEAAQRGSFKPDTGARPGR